MRDYKSYRSMMRRARRGLLASGVGLALAASAPGLASADQGAKPHNGPTTKNPAPPNPVSHATGHKVG
jgi:hypothetical protein